MMLGVLALKEFLALELKLMKYELDFWFII